MAIMNSRFFKSTGRFFWVTLIACCFFLVSVQNGFSGKELYKGGKKAKYVLFFIGDGLGMPQRTAAEEYMKQKEGKDFTLLMNELPAQGVTTTYANDRFITGSAAASTAMASGVKTNINYIGVDPDFEPVETIAEMAQKQGKKVGIISSVSIDHATPAAFYSHQPHRKKYYEISMDLANSDFDFFGGGGFKDPAGKKSKNPGKDALETARKNGYKIVTEKNEFMNLDKNAGKVIAYNKNLPDGKALPYAIDNTSSDISIAEFTEKAIELLENDEGFFLMVEGGKIDWACHANDAVASIKDTLAFDDALRVGYEFYKKHPDETLLVVSGDHECGGLTLGFAGTVYGSYFELLKKQTNSFKYFTDNVMASLKEKPAGKIKFDDVKPMITRYFGLKFEGEGQDVLKEFEIKELKNAFAQSMIGDKVNKGTPEYLLYGGYDPLTVKITHILNAKAGLGWTSYSHTGVPVTTSAIGLGSETFNGYYDNTDIAKKIMAVMGVKKQFASQPDDKKMAVK